MGAPAPIRTTVVAVALLATLAITRLTTPITAAAAPPLDQIPAVFAGWVGSPAPPLAPDVARVLAADQYLHRYYQGPEGVIEMDVAYYGQPRVGANMHSPLNCLPGNGWSVTDVRDIVVSTPSGQWPLRDTIVERRGVRFALTYWFQSRNRIVGDELRSRLYLVGDALRRKPADAGLVRLIMAADANASDERATLARFAATLIPEISTRLSGR
jgi:EpsI family protein